MGFSLSLNIDDAMIKAALETPVDPPGGNNITEQSTEYRGIFYYVLLCLGTLPATGLDWVWSRRHRLSSPDLWDHRDCVTSSLELRDIHGFSVTTVSVEASQASLFHLHAGLIRRFQTKVITVCGKSFVHNPRTLQVP